ncbi:MAG: hypothetical protein ACOYBY_05890 [Dermatophilaceae bacterium]
MDSTPADESTHPSAKPKAQPGAFPPVGASLTVKRRAYVLTDGDGRTWLALDPVIAPGGVMQPLLPGQTAKVVNVQDDGLVLRVSSPGGLDNDLDAFLVPRRMVPPAMGAGPA